MAVPYAKPIRTSIDRWRSPRGAHRLAAVIIVALMLVTAALIISAGDNLAYFHLMYVPIVVAAFCFQTRGALLASAAAGLLAGPLLPLDVLTGSAQDPERWMLRLGLFLFVGAVAGQAQALLNRQLEEVERLVEKVAVVYSRVLTTFADTVAHRDRPTGGHCERMAHNAQELGSFLGLVGLPLETLHWAALLHDLGKIAIPERILLKPGPLTDHEFAEMQEHVNVGAEILLGVSADFLPVVEGVRSHHERWDGTGYPRGLSKEEIPVTGRVLAVVDVFDALTHHRPYRDPVPPDEALAYIRSQSGKHFDPQVVKAFEQLYRERRIRLAGDRTDESITPVRFHARAISY